MESNGEDNGDDPLANPGWSPLAPTDSLTFIGWNEEKKKKKGKGKKRKHKKLAHTATRKAKKAANNAPVVISASAEVPLLGHHWDEDTGELTIHSTSESNLCIEGTASVKAIRGAANVLGYRLIEGSDRSTTLHCPSWSNPIALEAAVCGDVDTSVVLQIRSSPPDRKGHTFKFRASVDVRPVAISDSWKSGCDTVLGIDSANRTKLLLQEPQISSTSSRTLICGAKSTGKSTLLRYLVNRYLSDGKAKAVMVLDCDVGQPECSPPGMLTLSLVQEPLLSPPHLRMKQEHVKAYFYGHVTSRTDPPTYLEMITGLLTSYTNYVAENHGGNETDIPLVVNTDGWVKGFGFEILSTIIQTLQPSVVLQLVGDSPGKRFGVENILPSESNLVRLDAYSLFIESPIPPKALRSLRICTYFLEDTSVWNRVIFGESGILDYNSEIANTLAARKPRAVAIHSMRCHVIGLASSSPLEQAAVLDALNGSIVGLGVDKEGELHPSCVGLGIIRSIDRTKMLFYILTPVPAKKLVNTTTFIKGSLELPVECVYRGVHAEAFPYIACRRKVEGLGGTIMKSRNNMGRKN